MNTSLVDVEPSDTPTVRNRSTPMSWRGRLLALVPLSLFISYVVWVDVSWANVAVWFLITFYVIVAGVTVVLMTAGLFWRSFTHLPPAQGRILAVVPVYNEEPHLLYATLISLTQQTRPPDAIHVVDDGSTIPVEEFYHPLITWHHQPNRGKRHAQANILRRFRADEWDFIVTVDSDSVCDPDAVEHLLRSMSNPKIHAATGMIYTRNWQQNLLTRLTDINLVTSCLLFRMFRSWMGVVTPTSGALALYRSAVIYDNLEDYVTSGTAGDDRRLSFYALLRGQVVGVHEAVVETALPHTYKGMFLQRMRWSKSAWLGIPFVLTNLKLLPMVLYMYPLVFTLMWPFIVLILADLSITNGSPALLLGALYWEMVAITMTGIYAIYRPSFTWKQRLGQFALAPLYPIMGILILRPASYWALTKLRSTSWHTRETKPAKPAVLSRTLAGAGELHHAPRAGSG